MNASNKLCEPLLPTYSDFKPINDESVIGYKMAMKRAGSYYSLVTGFFRYKSGTSVSMCSYSSLYENEVTHYNPCLKDRMAIFATKEEALLALEKFPELEGDTNGICLIEIELSGNLESAKYSNQFIGGLNVYVGEFMDNIREVR